MSNNDNATITISTGLIAAIAKWAHTDGHRPIGAVAFRPNNTICATDGNRLVIVPHETNGCSFGVTRSHLLAAIAAQDVLERDGVYPRLDHDLVETNNGTLAPADGQYGYREISMTAEIFRVAVHIGSTTIYFPLVDISTYPQVESVLIGDDSASPDGYLLDARYLAGVEEVNNAIAGYKSGVRVTKWSALNGNGARGPLVLEGVNGVTFVVMPQRDTVGTVSP